MVQEIHQVLMDREDTCHRTCFSLQLDGNVLDNFAELKTIEGLQEGSVLKVVEGKFWRLGQPCQEDLSALGSRRPDAYEDELLDRPHWTKVLSPCYSTFCP